MSVKNCLLFRPFLYTKYAQPICEHFTLQILYIAIYVYDVPAIVHYERPLSASFLQPDVICDILERNKVTVGFFSFRKSRPDWCQKRVPSIRKRKICRQLCEPVSFDRIQPINELILDISLTPNLIGTHTHCLLTEQPACRCSITVAAVRCARVLRVRRAVCIIATT